MVQCVHDRAWEINALKLRVLDCFGSYPDVDTCMGHLGSECLDNRQRNADHFARDCNDGLERGHIYRDDPVPSQDRTLLSCRQQV